MSVLLRVVTGTGLFVLLAASTLHAQSQVSSRSGGSAVEVDFRMGGLWPAEGNVSRPSAGGRVAFHPSADGWARRLSLQATGDYRPTSRAEGFDTRLDTRTLTEESLMVFSGGLGIELLRTPRVVVDARVGGAVVRAGTDVSIDSADGFVEDRDRYENVCAYQGFGYLCTSAYEVGVAFAVGLRRYLTSDNGVFVGVDYTGLTEGHHLLVGSFGIRLD